MTNELLFTLTTSFAIFYVGVVIFFHQRKSASNKLFLLISVITVFWSIANYLSLTLSGIEALFSARLVLFFAVPHVILFYLFAKNFPNEKLIISNKNIIIISVIGFVVMLLTLTPYVFEDIKLIGDSVAPIAGPLIPIIGLTFIGFLLMSVFTIIKKIIKAKGLERQSWSYMLFGFVLSYTLLIVTNFVLVNIFNQNSFLIYGPLFMVPSIVGTAYSILKYQLLNVKAIATEIIVFVLLVTSLLELLISTTGVEMIIRSIFFVVFLSVGILLIKSVLKEVDQRERLQILSDQLAVANEKLKSLDKLKTEFLSLASHQLRSPLTAIKGYTSMLLEGSFGEIGEKQKEAIDRVFQSSQHLTKVVEDLLNVSKIEQGGMQYVKVSFDLSLPAGELARDLSVTAEKRGLKMTFETDKREPYMVFGDMEKIRQVMLNFIDNSIKYTEKGSINVKMGKDMYGKRVTFSVTDTGMGMTPEIKETLFQKFNRGEGAKLNTSGSGLGLYLAKQIIEAHDGIVKVESLGPGKGSTFTLELQSYESDK
jgi:signal transduction histidine kinase